MIGDCIIDLVDSCDVLVTTWLLCKTRNVCGLCHSPSVMLGRSGEIECLVKRNPLCRRKNVSFEDLFTAASFGNLTVLMN